MPDVIHDLLVIGGGMAGLSAAASVARKGGSVAIVERAPALGGSAMFAGYVWTAPSLVRLASSPLEPEINLQNV